MPQREHPYDELDAVGRAARQLRRERGLAVAEVAAAASLAVEWVEALERGGVDPTFDELVALSDALGTPPSAFVALAERLRDAGSP
ncbi:MAG: helix-turn-helix domain-containing protein [Solirubrobacteraceae bacterium]